MSIRKRNEFLDNDDSEEDLDNGHDSEAAEERKGASVSRASKRRRLERDESEEDDLEEPFVQGEGEAEALETFNIRKAVATNDSRLDFDGNEVDSEDGAQSDHNELSDQERSVLKPSTPKQVAKAAKVAHKSGVIYISRVPPFMKPQTLRHYLAPHAPKGLGRIFLTPEDHASHVSRVKRGGNKKKSFVDGWVEFMSKREAKLAADTLNGNIIGGKKGGFYHDDLWSMKYLKGFKWHHLTEQIANENAERAARLREEIRKTRKENKAFAEDFERGKMLEGMEKRGQGKKGESKERRKRDFVQKKSQKLENKEVKGRDSAELKRVLAKIF